MKFTEKYAVHPSDFRMYDTDRIRNEMLIEKEPESYLKIMLDFTKHKYTEHG